MLGNVTVLIRLEFTGERFVFVWTEPSAGPFSVNYSKCDYVRLYITCNDTKGDL